MPNPLVTNALSVDLEEYYHALVFQEATRGRLAGRLESRVEIGTDRVLALLAARGIKATFFIVGEIAEAHPGMIRKIAQDKHEIACHGYHHTLVSGQSAAEFRAGIRRAKAVLEDIAGEPVVGYRAPNFSIGPHQPWAYPTLAEEGFLYDSSTYPIVHDRYGDRHAPRFAYDIWRNGHARLIEFPIGTVRLFGIGRVNAVEDKPVMFYFHTWELDPEQPRPPMAWHHRFRHYVGQERLAAKLARLLERTSFGTARDVLGLSPRPLNLSLARTGDS
jgi:hypothetical protein